MIKTYRLALVAVLLLSFQRCWADHPDVAHRPIGRAEDSLAGVYINARARQSIVNEDGVYIEPMAEVLRTLGNPQRVTVVADSNECERNYFWAIEGIRVEVGSGCIFQTVSGRRVMRAHGAYSVQVWKSPTCGGMAATGRGLALGDSWSRVIRLYGNRCECGKYALGTGTQNTHGLKYARYAVYIWDDQNVKLEIDADSRGRVVHMMLAGDLE